MSIELELLLHKAVAEEEVQIPFSSNREANNFRQKLYRFREQLRYEEENPLALLADRFTFKLDGTKLDVKYKPSIWEKIDDNIPSES